MIRTGRVHGWGNQYYSSRRGKLWLEESVSYLIYEEVIDDIDVIAKTYCLQHSKANFPVQLLNELRKNLQTAIKAKARLTCIKRAS